MIFQDSILQQIGIYQFGLIEAKEIVFSNEFADYVNKMFVEDMVLPGLVHLQLEPLKSVKKNV